MNFYDEMPGLVDGGRAVCIVYLEFCKAFDNVSQKIPTTSWQAVDVHGMDKRTELDWKLTEQLALKDGDHWNKVYLEASN